MPLKYDFDPLSPLECAGMIVRTIPPKVEREAGRTYYATSQIDGQRHRCVIALVMNDCL